MKKLWRLLTKKEQGSSVYILAMMFLLLIIVLFYFFYYQKAIEVVGNNLKNDLDSSNLASAYVDLNQYAADREDFHIVSLDDNASDFSSTGNAQVLSHTSREYKDVLEHFTRYLTAIRENIGVKNSGFSGGSCGWAANMLNAKNFKIDRYMILEPERANGSVTYNRVTVYEIKDITNVENPVPEITRYRYSSASVPINGAVATIDTPSVYSQLSFTLALPINALNADNREEKVVTTSAMCGVVKNEEPER